MREILALGIPPRRANRYLMKAMSAGAALMILLAWSSLQLDWSLMGILLSITALMS